MIETILQVTLQVEGPLLTRDSGPGAFGVDAAMARSGMAKGAPHVPRSLIKGRLREAMSELHEAAGDAFPVNISEWFGTDTGDAVRGEGSAGRNEPVRGRLELTDFLCRGDFSTAGWRHRIKVDPASGTVQEGALLVMEDLFGSGSTIRLEGTLSFFCADGDTAQVGRRQLELGLRWMTQLGAGRTAGFGRITAVTVTQVPIPLLAADSRTETASQSIPIELYPQAPFCFSRHKIGGNLFESEAHLPGNALKGCLATVLSNMGAADFPTVRRHFDAIRIRHAFPSCGSKRASVAPLSIVFIPCLDGKPELRDAVAFPEGVVVPHGKGEEGYSAPSFRVDWKEATVTACDEAFGWAEPPRELRVRTAIDSRTRRGQPAALFAHELIVPAGLRWRSVIDLPKLLPEEVAELVAELRALLASGFHHLGKTKAVAKVIFPEADGSRETAPAPVAGAYRITLQTPALLADPRYQTVSGVSARYGAFLPAEVHALYADAWRDLSGGALELSHLFASQSLAGGNYLHHRFQLSQDNAAYRPWLLTDAGSVFVLKPAPGSADIQTLLERWLARGLPLPAWAQTEFTDAWQTNPFIPENGFGEIAINLSVPGVPALLDSEVDHA